MELHAGNPEDVGAVQTLSWTAHQELQKTSKLTVEDAGMHHANMVRNVAAGLQKALNQEQIQTYTPTVMQAHVYHVANAG